MAPERYVQGQRVSTANDLSQITTKVQALNISDSRRGRETTSHRYNDRSVDEDGFTTVRHGQKPTNEGGYTRRRIEPRGAGTLNRDVREQQASDPDTDAGNDSRSRRLPRDQFKPGLIVRAALHVSHFSEISLFVQVKETCLYFKHKNSVYSSRIQSFYRGIRDADLCLP